MSFEVRNTGNHSEDRVQIDWESLNKYIVETAQLQQQECLVGIVSGVHDLGVQPQEDAQLEWKGTPEEEAAEIAKNKDTYFEDLKDYGDGGKVKRYKRFPVKPAQSVAITVDFPDIQIDKGQFFGKSNPAPLRLVLGGEFKSFIAKPLSLTLRKNDKTNNQWSFPFNHTLYKMAVGAKIINQGEPFLPNDIDKLLGKALQFKAQVFFNKEGFYTEKCAFAAGLSRGQVAPELDESLLSMVMFNADNKKEHLDQLRSSIKNTMRKASDFAESKLKDQIGEAPVKGDNKPAESKQEEAQSSEPDEVDTDDFDSDQLPF